MHDVLGREQRGVRPGSQLRAGGCFSVTCHGGPSAAHWGHVGISWRTHHGHTLSGIHVEIPYVDNKETIQLLHAPILMAQFLQL